MTSGHLMRSTALITLFIFRHFVVVVFASLEVAAVVLPSSAVPLSAVAAASDKSQSALVRLLQVSD